VVAEAPRLLTPATIRELARRYDIRPSRALGQNFVVDQNTIRRVVKLAQVTERDRVIEVGAGIGALTLALSAAAERVLAVEIDRRLVPALEEVTRGLANTELIVADALTLDYASVLGGVTHRLVANLPYGVATPLIAHLLETVPEIDDMVFMVQREIGERLVARPGTDAYGGVSVLVAYHAETKVLGKVPRAVFWPVPKVESLLVRLTRRPPSVSVQGAELMRVVRAAFSQRRKILRNALAAGLELEPERVAAAIANAGIDPGARAETLGLTEFARLTEALKV
jgi:16S rRNA (adenine1518-N6/adenine1519-N6)-dimethyltransferase